jgi:predicted dehydrogenase
MPESLKVALLTEPGGPHLGIYVDLLGANPYVKEVSVADEGGEVFPLCREKWTARFGEIPVYRDYRDLLRERQPDLVVVCFSSDHAPAPIEAALLAGSHVLAEKPACVNADDFARLNRMADGKGRHLMLAFATRMNPMVVKARELVRSGSLGKLYGATAFFIADQTRLRSPKYQASWFASKARAGGGFLIWLGIHYVDALQYITGQNVAGVCGFTANVGGQPIDVEDAAAITMEFNGGMVATLQTGYYLDRHYHGQIRIWGSDGWLRADLINGTPMEWHLNSEQQVRQMAAPPNASETYPAFIRAVVDSVRTGGAPLVTGDECLHVLRAIFAAYTAASTGRTQKLA